MGTIAEFVEQLAGLASRRRPPDMPGDPPALPAMDADVAPPSIGESDRPSAPLIILEYRDSHGSFSRRRVTILSLEAGEEGDYLRSFCHEREALRSFRLDRILAVVDPLSGEYLSEPAFKDILSDICGVAVDWAPPSPQQQAQNACKSGVLVLMLVAWADGRFQEEERAVVADYIRETCASIRDYDPSPILDWASRQYPCPEKVARILARIVETDRDGAQMDRLLSAAIRLAKADGEVVLDEAAMIRTIRFARRVALCDLGHKQLGDLTEGWAFGVPLPAFCDALDVSHDQRVARKKVSYVWARGNPAMHRFRRGDVFHAPASGGPGCVTLQISEVKDPADLDGVQIVSFGIYQKREAGIVHAGDGKLTAPEFELVLRDGPARLLTYGA